MSQEEFVEQPDGQMAKLVYDESLGKTDIYTDGLGLPDGPGHDHTVVYDNAVESDGFAMADYVREDGVDIYDSEYYGPEQSGERADFFGDWV